MNLKRLTRWASAALIGVATVTSLNVAAETAALRVSIEGGSFNSKFKFWDASEGCPSYHDIPGAKDFMGGVRASDKGADKKLTVGQPVHVFMYRPKDYLWPIGRRVVYGNSPTRAAGGAEWRRHASLHRF